MVKICVVTLPGALVSPPPRLGQFTRQIALGGLMTLICAESGDPR